MVMCAKSQLDHWTRYEIVSFCKTLPLEFAVLLQIAIWIKMPVGLAWHFPVDVTKMIFLQVWIIADKVPGRPAESSGTVCHRLGVQPMQPKGLSWDYGIGVSFKL